MIEWLRGYLVFSRKERTGVLALLVMIGSVWLLPRFFSKPERLGEELLLRADSAYEVLSKAGTNAEGVGVVKTFRLFPFDPNLANDADWEMLGVRPKTVTTIRNYLNRGGRFRHPGDLMKIYGLRKDEAERLMSFVRIKPQSAAGSNSGGYPKYVSGRPSGNSKYVSGAQSGYPKYVPQTSPEYKTKAYRVFNSSTPDWKSGSFPKSYERTTRKIVEINEADSSAFESLPGIGPKLASRIIRFRNACGGFYSVDQVAGIYGISDTLFLILKPLLSLQQADVKKIYINVWEADSLAMHPYIQRHEAKAIVNFRKQHGRFQTVEDLSKVTILTNEWVEKIRYYLSFD